MTPQSEDVVRRFLETFGTDAGAFAQTLHPEIEWFPFEDNHVRSYGVAAGLKIREGWVEAWEEMSIDVERMDVRDDEVVVGIHVIGRGLASGVEVDTRLYMHFKVRDGRIVYLFEYTDQAAALKAAGVSSSSSVESV
jgi:ketosteroid isomerase-like protein